MAHDRLTRIERTALLALSLTSLSILSCILLWHSCGHKGYTPTETELQRIEEFRKAVAGMEADTTVPDVPHEVPVASETIEQMTSVAKRNIDGESIDRP